MAWRFFWRGRDPPDHDRERLLSATPRPQPPNQPLDRGADLPRNALAWPRASWRAQCREFIPVLVFGSAMGITASYFCLFKVTGGGPIYDSRRGDAFSAPSGRGGALHGGGLLPSMQTEVVALEQPAVRLELVGPERLVVCLELVQATVMTMCKSDRVNKDVNKGVIAKMS